MPAPAAVVEVAGATVASLPSDASGAIAMGVDYLALLPVLQGVLGDPMQDVIPNPAGCGTYQLTTNGLIYENCDTGLVAFVANDGLQHWGLLNGELLQWSGTLSDAPPDAIDVAATQMALVPVCGDTLEPGADAPCLLADAAPQLGILTSAGETNAYEYSAIRLSNDVVISLSQLPADYDLYLADANGTILGSSVQEDLTPESIEVNVGPGVYYVYVHVDDGRLPDPTTSYLVQAALQPTADAPTDETTSGQDASVT